MLSILLLVFGFGCLIWASEIREMEALDEIRDSFF